MHDLMSEMDVGTFFDS